MVYSIENIENYLYDNIWWIFVYGIKKEEREYGGGGE